MAEEGAKRKLDEMTDEDTGKQSSATNEDESATKKIKSTATGDQQTSGVADVTSENKEKPATPSSDATDGSGDHVTLSTAAPATGQKTDKEITLVAGRIYQVQCPEIGDFHVRAGATGSFCVKAATLIITNTQGTVVFPDPAITLSDEAEVEVEDTLSGTTKLTVLPYRVKIPAWMRGFTPVQIIGLVNNDITITGRRPAVITGNGGRLTLLGPANVTIEGSIQSLKNNGNGTVKVNGKVTGAVQQTGSGCILITEDAAGNISNLGGGRILVRDKGTGKLSVWKNSAPGAQKSSGVADVTSENKDKPATPSSSNAKTNGYGDHVTGQKTDKEITLVAGGIYRVQCPELGDFTIIAGASGGFRVKAVTLNITNTQGTVMFPHPAITLTDGAEVEVKNTGTGTTSVSVLSGSIKAPAREPINLLFVNTLVNGRKMVGMIDTGANITAMSLHGAKQCEIAGRLDTTQSYEVRGLGKESTLGKVEGVHLEIEDKIIKASISILEELRYDFIIGLDSLIELKSILNFDQMTLQFDEGSITRFIGPDQIPKLDVSSDEEDEDELYTVYLDPVSGVKGKALRHSHGTEGDMISDEEGKRERMKVVDAAGASEPVSPSKQEGEQDKMTESSVKERSKFVLKKRLPSLQSKPPPLLEGHKHRTSKEMRDRRDTRYSDDKGRFSFDVDVAGDFGSHVDVESFSWGDRRGSRGTKRDSENFDEWSWDGADEEEQAGGDASSSNPSERASQAGIGEVGSKKSERDSQKGKELERKESKRREAETMARPRGYRDLDLREPIPFVTFEAETHVTAHDLDREEAKGRGMTVFPRDNILWPTCSEIDMDLAGKKIEDYIKRCWSLDPKWLFHVQPLEVYHDSYRKKFVFEAKFSVPSPTTPVPPATASVFFVFEIPIYTASRDEEVKVTYVLEGTTFPHSPGKIPFQEKWLWGIIQDKLRIQKAMNF